MSVKVVDLNTNSEDAKEGDLPKIEESKEASIRDASTSLASIRDDEEPTNEPVNEIDEGTNETPKEEPKEEKPKRETQKDRIQCPKCLKEVSLKTYRYSHEKVCGGKLSAKPVKPHTNPKSKAKAKATPPKPPPEVYYSSSDEEAEAVKPVKTKQLSQSGSSLGRSPKQPPQAMSFAEQYQLLQQQMVQQKRDRYNSISSQMFGTRSKRR